MNSDEKICPRCAETIKRAAVVCRYCRHEFGEAPAAAEAMDATDATDATPAGQDESGSGHVKPILAAVGMVAAVGLLVMCTAQAPKSDALADENLAIDMNAVDLAIDNAAAALANASDVPAEAAAGWAYDARTDDLRGGTIHFARATSVNSVTFDFPYGGGSTLGMTVRRHPEYGDDVMFTISSGQFNCGIDDCSGTINLGDGPEPLYLVESDDNSSDTLFVSNGEGLIARLKRAERIVVELPFYQEGNRQFTFQPKALVWPPKGAANDSQVETKLPPPEDE